jgi:nucleoside-diphosphate-sugar epimerase
VNPRTKVIVTGVQGQDGSILSEILVNLGYDVIGIGRRRLDAWAVALKQPQEYNTLEQIGDNYKDFVDYLIAKKPEVCIHFEPSSELLDKEDAGWRSDYMIMMDKASHHSGSSV